LDPTCCILDWIFVLVCREFSCRNNIANALFWFSPVDFVPSIHWTVQCMLCTNWLYNHIGGLFCDLFFSCHLLHYRVYVLQQHQIIFVWIITAKFQFNSPSNFWVHKVNIISHCKIGQCQKGPILWRVLSLLVDFNPIANFSAKDFRVNTTVEFCSFGRSFNLLNPFMFTRRFPAWSFHSFKQERISL